ncbi:MAG: hypothetical protein R6U44_03755 [Archaeoglobaceae archaeon]
MSWINTWEEIFNSFDMLKKMLADRANCTDNCIEVLDPPYTIKVLKNEKVMVFQLEDKTVATLDQKGLHNNSEEHLGVIKEWCTALTSLGFKRYRTKSRI